MQEILTLIRTDILPPLIVAFIVAISAGALSLYRKMNQVISLAAKHDSDIEILKLEIVAQRGDYNGKIGELRGQMVGWDVIKRIELFMQQYAGAGKGNEAMSAFAGALRAESEGREMNQNLRRRSDDK